MSKILEESATLAPQNEAAEHVPDLAGANAPAGTAVSAHEAAPVQEHMPAEETLPTLEYEEIPRQESQSKFKVQLVKKRSRKAGVITLAALVVVAGLGAAAYLLGIFGNTGGFGNLGVQNSTEPPEGASVPAFSPIDPLEFTAATDGEFITVPDETGLELPTFGHGPQIAPEPQNYYIQTPHVSDYFTRAAQDESYVYFLQGPAATRYSLYKLMRANPSTGKTEPATNNGDNNIYSFALFGRNIITCEYKQATDSFAFYRNPKSGEHAQLLFETDSPAHMNVFDNKLFLLFVEEQTLGVFDFAADTQPSHIPLKPSADTAHYFAQFSVVNGYLYYGIWYDTETEADDSTQVSMEYLRRSLYTGETVTLLSCEGENAIWNPCWDDEGNAYYAQHDSEAMAFNLIAAKDGESPQVIGAFDSGENWPPIAFKDEFLITAFPREGLRQYSRSDFSMKLEVLPESQPFAATKDYFVTDSGLYRLFDFGFVPFAA